MSTDLSIRPVQPDELDPVLPLIRGYQEFYETFDLDPEATRRFYLQFTAGPGTEREKGWLYAAWLGDRAVGFACFFQIHSTLRVGDTLLLYDLFVTAASRGHGVGRGLIEVGVDLARERNLGVLEWETAPDNHRARRLYDSTGARPSTWVTYELEL